AKILFFKGDLFIMLKIFLSYSFDKKDEKVMNWFKNLIEGNIQGCEIVTAKRPKYSVIWEKIEKIISPCPVVLGILTKNQKIANKNEWKTKGWILSELGYGFGKGKDIPAFVEEGVKDIGIVSNKEYISFNRHNLDTKKKDMIDYLKSIIFPFEDQTYCFDTSEKMTCVYKSGLGVCQNIVNLRVTSDKFSQIEHMISLGDSAAKNLKFKNFKKLKETNISRRFFEQTLYADILEDIGNVNRKIEIVEVADESNDETKCFHLRFKPNLKSGDRIKYCVGWSSPSLFPISKVSMKNGRKKRNLKTIESTLTTHHFIKELNYRLCFEKGYPISGIPKIIIKDVNRDIVDRKKFDSSKDLYYNIFTCDFPNVTRNAQYIAQWRVK
ncbi:MAG: hypothetical protein JW983_07640, partial [Elusimicrobia bacterium]|nr:hypothetical protein [Elusimicrobiota bacterium]